MKTLLMYRDRQFAELDSLSSAEEHLIQDLHLDTVLNSMSNGDEFLHKIARSAILSSLTDKGAIVYRQDILRDCLANPQPIREMYELAVEALTLERRVWGWTSDRYPEGTLHRSIEVLNIFFRSLRKIRTVAERDRSITHAEGLVRLFDMLTREIDDSYLAEVQAHLDRLRFPNGMLMDAEIGAGATIENCLVRRPDGAKREWTDKLGSWLSNLLKGDKRFTYVISNRDEAGLRALSDIRGEGIRQIASVLASSTTHVLNFFKSLRQELAFYIGCLNLHGRLIEKGESFCFPEPAAPAARVFESNGLYDVALTLQMQTRVIDNDIKNEALQFVLITGPNRGGKTTFLRSIGLAQLMMQSGLFVTATKFRWSVCAALFTHFAREEDANLRRGKFDEELARMRAIVDVITPNSLLLLNESFASTNEREGSEIARQIISALLDNGINIFCVTHMFALASHFYHETPRRALFLRAQRLDHCQRSFKILSGEPLSSSHGKDLYRKIFDTR